MKKMVIAILASTSLMIGTVQYAVAADSYVLDKDHTNVIFFVNHLGFSNMEGEFDDVKGSFVFNKEDVSESSVKVTIQLASVDTDVEALDEHLRGPDFFDTAQFPTAVFESTKIEKTGEKTGTITGNLTMHGVTKPVTLDVTFNREGENPNIKKYVAGFSASATLTRSEFGIKAYVPYVGDEITLRIEAEGLRQDGE